MRRPMRSTIFLGILCVTAACSAAPPPPPPAPAGPTPAEMVAAADALERRLLEAFNQGDADGFLAQYWNSPDLVILPPDAMGIRGFDAAKASLTEMFKTMPGAKMEVLESRNDPHGTVVLGSGRWKLTIPAAKGPATVIEGRYSDVKAQKDGRWVYVMDHASVPLPPPPDAAKEK